MTKHFSLATWIKKNTKTLCYILAPLVLITATVAVFSLLQPAATTSQINDNTTAIETSYDYKATIIPNILYPKGGTVEVDNTIFTKITTALPFNLNSTISSANEVTVKGTHQIQIVVNAVDLWERVFPLGKQESFELAGTEISLIDSALNIDLTEITAFIEQVEEETEIRAEQYTIEVVPNIEGMIHYAGKDMPIPEQDALVFQLTNDEIVLISEKSSISVTPFTTTDAITNTFNFFGAALPLGFVRLVSSLVSILLLLPLIYILTKVSTSNKKSLPTEVDKINKKYGGRIIPVSQHINTNHKSLITLQSFKDVIKIADEKELPIFCYKVHLDESAVYFIVDGDYIYNYETIKLTIIQPTAKGVESDEAYAKG